MMMRSLSGAAVAATACLAAVATAQQSCGRAPECRTVRPQLLAQHARAAFTLLVNAAQETCCSFVSRNSTRDDVAPRMPETRQRCPNSVSCCRSTTATALHCMRVVFARLASVSSERVATLRDSYPHSPRHVTQARHRHSRTFICAHTTHVPHPPRWRWPAPLAYHPSTSLPFLR